MNTDPMEWSPIVLMVVGLLLAFFGSKLTKVGMFFVGGIIGAALGLAIGSFFLIGGPIGIIIMIVGAILGFFILGGMLLAFARFTLPLVAGYYGFKLVYDGIYDSSQELSGLILAVLAGIFVFALAFIFYEKLLGIVTAVIGGIMVMNALEGWEIYGPVNLLIGFTIIIMGAWNQSKSERTKKKRRKKKRPAVSYDDDRWDNDI